jgi:hypothetical protein
LNQKLRLWTYLLPTGGADQMAKEHAFEIALVAVGVISTALVWAAFSM